ncbi:hypothetical protein CRG98_020917 [Punica granatum]|uniref:Uncharacterized protein n=1 Tax=Punica granatum TaxID=22663 RepID=A0A2I0JS41_PUNGR|nr:hypothetical protein CRG98_020917 [Punica granatum]
MGQSAFADVPDIPPSIHPRLTFPYTLRTLLLSRLRVQGLRVRFTAFRTSRPRTSRSVYCFLDFASGLLLSRLRVRFTTFRTSRPWTSRPLYCFPDFASMDFASALLLFGLRVHFTCFPRALAHHLPLHILQIPIMLLFYDRRGEPPRRTTTEAVAGTKKGVPSHFPETAAAAPSPGSTTRNVQPESRNSQGRFPDSFPRTSRLGNIPLQLREARIFDL